MAGPSAAPAPLFLTHHAPVGAWSSLMFGAAGRGITLLQDTSTFRADLLVGVWRAGAAKVTGLPFAENPSDHFQWEFVRPDLMRRTLTVCVDEIAADGVNGAGITLRVFTPQAALPNPKRSGNLQYATAPGLLLELVVDNSGSDLPAVAFIGVGMPAGEGDAWLRPVDWSSKALCGVGGGARWILAAAAAKGENFTVLGDDLLRDLARVEGQGAAMLNPAAPGAVAGGIAIRMPPRSSRTVPLVWATYLQGLVTQGMDARYMYTNYFPRVEAVANFLLHNSQRVRESCASFDARAAAACADQDKLAVFSQAVRAYNAASQVVEASAPAGPAAYFAAISPRGGRAGGLRNDLARVVDHLPWELYRNPWVIRNLFDLATTAYAYHDQVRFPGDAESANELREGGMTFSRDFGCGSAYAPAAVTSSAGGPPVSAFDGAGTGPGWSGGRMASEILLNSIYMLTGYALLADDTPWAKTRLPFARELLVSLENRDYWDPAQRTGILKAESAAAGDGQLEQTVFEDFPPELSQARGNLYLAVKTFCANLLLTTYFQNNNDLHSADYSYAFAQKTAAALVAAFNPERQILSAHVLAPASAEAMLAALEPLALPTYLGLTSTLPDYFPELFQAIKSHAVSCLKPAPEGCFDVSARSLRLISTSDKTHPAKVISILFVLERLFQIDIASQLPGVWTALAESLPGAGASLDPDLITAALFVKPTGS